MTRLPTDGRNHGWERVLEPTKEGSFITRAGDGRMPAGAPDEEVNILVDGSHTRGLASFLEYRIGPNRPGPPGHWHRGHDELFYVASGELVVSTSGNEETLKAHDFLFVPRGVTHSFRNPSDEECIFVSGWNPPGGEQVFRWIQELSPEELASPGVLGKLLEDIDTHPVPPGT